MEDDTQRSDGGDQAAEDDEAAEREQKAQEGRLKQTEQEEADAE